MSLSKQLLFKRYIQPIPQEKELYIGVELEFPIVSKAGRGTKSQDMVSLLSDLMAPLQAIATAWDDAGNIIGIQTPAKDMLVFEVTYTTLEIAFEKASNLHQIVDRFQDYLPIIQGILSEKGYELQGKGLHPYWKENDYSPIPIGRYKLLMAYLALGKSRKDCHSFLDYAGFIHGNQVQFDVDRTSVLPVLNFFNLLEPVKAYLFANSGQDEIVQGLTIARDFLWEKSMHGVISKNVGPFDWGFDQLDDYLDVLDQSAMFCCQRDGVDYYFPPMTVSDYFQAESIQATDLLGQTSALIPQNEDIQYHRAYHYQLLTTRSTVELRSVCAQPFDQSFVPTAFQLGLLINRTKAEKLISNHLLYREQKFDIPQMRHLFSKKYLDSTTKSQMHQLSKELVILAEEGLQMRDYGEEIYLQSLKEKLDQ
ncbi:gamma-glutamylcysteine synthetase [Streptococcus suis]|uniref:glutamate--cysteine ligase n=1 Tax=Streptococcus suivaginalis TaxID=3028082 RepID=A0AA96VFA9_9STRE|nr:glutamate-cysteine ligase family protein [Streptococcus sp. 29896]MCK4027698.1 gamma-glutamylcysteine synthetase [Streptococcus suis]WNY47228.1 glutamate-cysteine ligase family protein [Streptococcus sp. 29896]